MPVRKQIVTIEQHNSLRFIYNAEKRQFELTFKPGLEAVIPECENLEICLFLKEETVRQMADYLLPIDPETIH